MAKSARTLSKGRAAWSILDQAASSLTNFGLSILVLRSTTLSEFGVFTVVYLSYQMALGLNRALVTESLVIRFSADEQTEIKAAAARATGAAFSVGLAAGAVLCVAAAFSAGDGRSGFLVMGLALPFLVLQDSLRSVFFTLGSPQLAFWNDLAWGVIMAVFLVGTFVSGNDSLPTLLGSWAVAGALAALIGTRQLGRNPLVLQAIAWIRQHMDLGRRFVVEYIFARGGGYLAMLSVSAIAGLSSLGAINGSRVLFGPITILFAGTMAVALPEGVRLVEHSPERLRPAVLRFGLFLGGSAIALGILLFFLPSSAGEALVRDSRWDQIHVLIVPTAILMAAEGFGFAQRTGLRILADARRSLRAQAIAGPVILLGAVAGAFIGGAEGAAWGFAIATSLASAVWTRLFASSQQGKHEQAAVPR